MEEIRLGRVAALPSTAQAGAGGTAMRVGEGHRLHHLPDVPIGQHHHGIAIAVGQVESQRREVGHFLHRSRRQHQRAVIAVAAAFDDLVVIALLGRDIAQSGAAAHDVSDHAGQFGARQVAHALLHQADARSAGGRHQRTPAAAPP